MILRRLLLFVFLGMLVLTSAIWVQHALARPDMTRFAPWEMGRLESAMWRSYYEGHWFRLGAQTMTVACGQYGFSWWDGIRSSFHAARSARFFRKNTDDARCLPELEQYYAIIRNATGRNFDIRKAAELELKWWKDRRNGVAPRDYARTIAQSAALVYRLKEADVLASATMRAEAMAYRDARRDGKMTESDWLETANQLVSSYSAVKEACATLEETGFSAWPGPPSSP